MKQGKKLSILLLGLVLLGGPLLNSCNNKAQDESAITSGNKDSVKSLEVTKQPTKLNYESGDVFDPTGMEVTATYEDGRKEVVTGYSYNRMPLSASDKSITISYKGKSTKVDITVTFVLRATMISVETKPNKAKYVVGESFDPDGMKVVAMMNDNTKKVITDYTYDKHDPLTLQDKEITITYNNGKTDLKTVLQITVEEEGVAGIEVTKNPTKMAYVVGEKFDAAGMEISSVTNNGKDTLLDNSKWVLVDPDQTFALEDGKTFGEAEVQIKSTENEDFITSIKVFVSTKKLKSIEMVNNPLTTKYYVDSIFNVDGIKFCATYEDNTSNDFFANTISYTLSNPGKLKQGEDKISISYAGFSFDINISVEDRVVVIDANNNIGNHRFEAEDLDTSKATLRQDFINAGRNFIDRPTNPTSGGLSICGYNPGSIFEITLKTDKETTIAIGASMSDTNLNYKINDGVQFAMDDTVLKAQDVTFTYSGGQDYWNWKDVSIGQVTLAAGEHTFKLTAINQRPNIDYFDFEVLKYGDQDSGKVLRSLTLKQAPTKTTYNEGEVFDPTGMIIEGRYNDYTKEEITDYTIKNKDKPLAGDATSVQIKAGDLTLNVPIKVKSLYDFTATEAGEKKIEAENLDTSNLQNSDGRAYIETNDLSSNGASLGHISGGFLTITFKTDKAFDLNVTGAFSKYEAYKLSDPQLGFKFKLDDTEVPFDDITLGRAEDGSNDWYNWKNSTIKCGKVEAGVHTFKIELKGGNIDYFTFNFADITTTK